MFGLKLLPRAISDSMPRLAVSALAASWLLASASAAAAFDVMQITDNSINDYYPAVSGSNVVWMGDDGNDTEIHFWDGGFPIPDHTIQITDNSTDDEDPDISGSNVVWGGYDDDGPQIYLWDGGFPIPDHTTQITDNSTFGAYPAISGSNVVWMGWDGHDVEIYFWDGGFPIPDHTIQITDNSTDDEDPDISGSNVVWHRWDDHVEIYFWDGKFPIPDHTTQITDNSTSGTHPAISGSNLVWMGDDGNDEEIYRTTIPGSLEISLLKYLANETELYGIAFEASKPGATTCKLQTPSDPGGSPCLIDTPQIIRWDLVWENPLVWHGLMNEIGTPGDDWTLTWDEGLATETIVGIDFGTVSESDWLSVPTITNPPDGASGVPLDTSIDWTWPGSPALENVFVALYPGPLANLITGPVVSGCESDELPHPPPPTTWPPRA